MFRTMLRVCCLCMWLVTVVQSQGIPIRPNGPIVGGRGPGSPFLTGSIVHGTCYFNDTYSPVKGRVDLRQNLARAPRLVEVRVQVMGLPRSTMSDQEHAMHVHQWGDTGRDCYNAGPHFDANTFSRGPNSMGRGVRHDGEFGNLRQTNDGAINISFNVTNIMLAGDNGILGRSIVLHESRDDLGLGRSPVRLRTGNSGPPIACCVIGLADSTNWNTPVFVNNQFSNPGLLQMNPVLG